MTKPTIGIIGAGKLGTTLGKLLVDADYPVLISGSGSTDKIALTVSVLIPGAQAVTNAELAELSDIIVLALPLSKYQELDAELLKGKLVIDAMNYWWEIDGLDNIYSDAEQSSSEKVQAYFQDSTIIKAFNHMGYHNLSDDVRPDTHDNRKAQIITGDDQEAVKVVEAIVEEIGFTPLYIGDLKNGVILEPGSPLFGASLGVEETQAIVDEELGKV
ncbi:NADPH-dependent F420 reductase [Aerococcaceae bacterium DSM 111022]|nr:NADPH-dependent F420 reductase [Aerococcaceae bacterium DSM 111022]